MASIVITAQSGESITLAGSPQEMADAVNYRGFAFSTNDDWYTIGDSKSTIDERPVADGAFGILRDWHPSLPISVNAWYRGADRAAIRAAKRQLAQVLANGKNVTMRFVDDDESTSRVLSIRSVVPDNSSGLTFGFVFHGVALDPVAYGAAHTFMANVGVSGGGLLFPLGTTPTKYWDFGVDGTSNRIQVTNNGTAETYPLLQVTGGLAGGFIVADITTGDVVRLDRNIPLGSTVTVNQRTGAVTIDGQSDISGFLTSYGFFSLQPGETHVIQFSSIGAVTGTPQLTLIESDAFL